MSLKFHISNSNCCGNFYSDKIRSWPTPKGVTWSPLSSRFRVRGWRKFASSVGVVRLLSLLHDTSQTEGRDQSSYNSIETPPIQEVLQRPVRVRFAPSPTGQLHVGGARTALFNWLHARKHSGIFMLRIEDTDLSRSTRENEESLLRDLRWLGLDWDYGPEGVTNNSNLEELKKLGPLRQSERGFIYKKYVEKLHSEGFVYPCFCSEEELERQRIEMEASGQTPKYAGTCRHLTPTEIEKQIAAGVPYVFRFKVPKDTKIVLHDIVRGDVVWDAEATFGDFIVMRSNGVPVYNFCVAIDDALMEISTVIRAEEHLTNTVRQILVLHALGFPLPSYAHCSLILGEDRTKLSKRHGATSVNQFRSEGYLPEALINYLALLGWHDGTEQEFYSREELTKSFSLSRLSKAPAVFDIEKLRWMNARYLRSLPIEKLRTVISERLKLAHLLYSHVDSSDSLTEMIAEVTRDSVELTSDYEYQVTRIFSYPLEETVQSGEAAELLTKEGGFYELSEVIVRSFKDGTFPCGENENHRVLWKEWIKCVSKETKRKGKHLFHPVRLALTGKMSGPDVGDVIRILSLAKGKSDKFVPLEQRIRILESFLARMQQL
ncbi:glutamyl-tRNA synthetase [Galdieria sulphuraria]|uniref:glutamate--tRNA ligase n=1 Tax=Galdieria sulphuraria TaxID=130081 RepID=M2XI72_GALSU|nr:glutamyl-tRNA synthetase [Galdieria sulphuraria]EME29787.1 glutamyl-tRNA synthetase [Galdieria sulphuraria]|eukprot:XP_005706307.1 glutamyl-tRNA synthetase [Galdieria sulphuraria]